MEASLFPGACPQCGSAWLDAEYDLGALPKKWTELVASRKGDIWRYWELLPFPEDTKKITMGEGWTPLNRAEGLALETGHKEVWIKDERQQPTGSFKDRQASFAISALKSQGISEIVLSSTGNAAAAYAAFCARAGIKLWVFLTSSVPAEKMRELALYGAEVVKITGTYDQVKEIAADFAKKRGIYYDTGAKAIPNKESMKTVAFEIAEQLEWQAPDWYIQAVSGGLGPLGVVKGFEELHQAGIINKVPKIGIVQVEGCAPMARSWERGLEEAESVLPDTLITVLATGKPGIAYRILKKATDAYGGAMVAVSDGDAFRAMRQVARVEGFSTEPAASVAFAGFEKLLDEGYIKPEEQVVINCSGHTFSAEKHALEDRYVVDLKMEVPPSGMRTPEGLSEALKQLDEQVTSIAIIDDNPHDSRLIRRLLQKYKRYRIFEAHNGPDGIDLVRQRRPELVVLDLTIPDMDGFSILSELKKDDRTAEIPVIIISGKDLTPDQHEFLGRNVQSIWQKGSFSGRELVSHVVEALGDDSEIAVEPTKTSPKGEDVPLDEFGEDTRQRILLVDDNVWDARLLRKLFEARGRYKVEVAENANQALGYLAEQTPNLIILDLILPDMDGRDLLEEIRAAEQTRHIPVVIVSAKDLDPDTRNTLNVKADSVWSKEMLDRNSLLAHVEKILAE
jgi:threonine synthase